MPSPNNRDPLTVTIKQAQTLSGLGRSKIFMLIGSGMLQSTLVGRRRLISYESLKTLLVPGNPERRGPGRPRKVERVVESIGGR